MGFLEISGAAAAREGIYHTAAILHSRDVHGTPSDLERTYCTVSINLALLHTPVQLLFGPAIFSLQLVGQVKGHFVKNHLCVFVNGLVENPAFNSQSKETLTSKDTLFGSLPKLSDSALKTIEKSEIVERCRVIHYPIKESCVCTLLLLCVVCLSESRFKIQVHVIAVFGCRYC